MSKTNIYIYIYIHIYIKDQLIDIQVIQSSTLGNIIWQPICQAYHIYVHLAIAKFNNLEHLYMECVHLISA